MRNFTILFTLLFSVQIMAKNLSMIAATGTTGLNLPEISYLTNVSPKINDRGDIAFQVMALTLGTYNHFVFVKENEVKNGSFKWMMPEGEYISDISLTNEDSIFLSTNDGGKALGVYDLNFVERTLERPFPWSSDIFSVTSPHMSEEGVLSYRFIAKNGPRQIMTKDFRGEVITTLPLFTEGKDGISYVFSPRQAGNYILVKIRYGELGDYTEGRPDRLWLVNTKTGRRTLVAQDRDAMPSSKIKSIENMYQVSDSGSVAFWAKTKKGRELFLSHRGITRSVLLEGDQFAKLDWFSPGINNKGSMILRGSNHDGKHILAFYNGETNQWSEVLKEGDSFELSKGKYVIQRRRALTFGGAVDINNKNEIVFNANTLNEESGEWMEAIYKLEL
jgi:hypothetical protein